MSLIYDFVFGMLPWIAYAIFTIGMVDKLYKWLSGAPSPRRTVPRKSTMNPILLALIDYLTHYRLFKRNVRLWFLIWPMMVSLAIVLLWHLLFMVLWAPPPTLIFIPLIFGVVLTLELILILVRQNIMPNPHSIGLLSDNIAFFLVLITALSGIAMALSPHSAGAFTLTVPPGITFHLETTPPRLFLLMHGILAQLVLMVAPFTKLTYAITGLITGVARELKRAEIVGD